MEAIASYDELLAKPGVEGTEAWDEAKRANPDLARRPEGPQTVHRLRLLTIRRNRPARECVG